VEGLAVVDQNLSLVPEHELADLAAHRVGRLGHGLRGAGGRGGAEELHFAFVASIVLRQVDELVVDVPSPGGLLRAEWPPAVGAARPAASQASAATQVDNTCSSIIGRFDGVQAVVEAGLVG
jgi:hypothetical protein